MARGTSTGMEDGRGDGKRDNHKDDGRDGSLMLLVVVVVYVSVYASVAVAVARTIVVGVAVVVVVVLAVAVCVVVAASSAAATAATTASGWWVPARCAWAPAATRCVRAAGGRVIQAGCELWRRAGEQHAANRAAPCREGSRSGTRLAATSEQARDRCRSLPCKPRRHCLLPGTRCANRPRPPGTTATSARCHTRLLRTMGKDHRQGPQSVSHHGGASMCAHLVVNVWSGMAHTAAVGHKKGRAHVHTPPSATTQLTIGRLAERCVCTSVESSVVDGKGRHTAR